jgi:hypothetical protein
VSFAWRRPGFPAPASRHEVPVFQPEDLIGQVDERLVVRSHQAVIPSARTTVRIRRMICRPVSRSSWLVGSSAISS